MDSGSGLKEQGGLSPMGRRSPEDMTVVQIPSSDKYLLIPYFLLRVTRGSGEGKTTLMNVKEKSGSIWLEALGLCWVRQREESIMTWSQVCLPRKRGKTAPAEEVGDVTVLEEMVSRLQDRLNLRKQAPFFMLITNPHF